MGLSRNGLAALLGFAAGGGLVLLVVLGVLLSRPRGPTVLVPQKPRTQDQAAPEAAGERKASAAKPATALPAVVPEEPAPEEPWLARMDEALNKKISFDFVETPLQDVVSFMASLVGATIIVDPAAVRDKAPTITLRVNEMRAGNALEWIAKMAELEAVKRDEALLLTTPALEKQARALDDELRPLRKPPDPRFAEMMQKRITFDFVETPLQDVISFLGSLADVPMVVDRKTLDAVGTVTLRVNDMRLEHALGWCCRVAGVTWVWLDGMALVATPERMHQTLKQEAELAKVRKAPPEEVARKLAKPVSFDFVETPLQDVVAFLGGQTDVNLVLDRPALKGEELKVGLRASDMPLDRALRWVCRVAGLADTWQAGAIFITKPENLGK